jgi:hypothetical protein
VSRLAERLSLLGRLRRGGVELARRELPIVHAVWSRALEPGAAGGAPERSVSTAVLPVVSPRLVDGPPRGAAAPGLATELSQATHVSPGALAVAAGVGAAASRSTLAPPALVSPPESRAAIATDRRAGRMVSPISTAISRGGALPIVRGVPGRAATEMSSLVAPSAVPSAEPGATRRPLSSDPAGRAPAEVRAIARAGTAGRRSSPSAPGTFQVDAEAARAPSVRLLAPGARTPRLVEAPLDAPAVVTVRPVEAHRFEARQSLPHPRLGAPASPNAAAEPVTPPASARWRPSTEARAGSGSAPPAPSRAAPAIDVAVLADQVERRLAQKAARERERRGLAR